MSESTFSFLGDAEPLQNRGHVIRMAMFHSFWSLLLGAFVAIGAFQIVRGETGFVVMLFIGLLFGLMTAYQASQYLRDLASRPIVFEGEIWRKWAKNNPLSWIVPLLTTLIAIAIYRVSVGEDNVKVLLVLLFGAGGFFFGWRALLPPLEQISTSLTEGEVSAPKRMLGAALGLFFLPSFYLVVENRILTVNWNQFAALLEDDVVRCTCYPHSLTVERLERYDTNEKQFVPASGAAIS